MVDLCVTSPLSSILCSASTDRTVTLYDLRQSNTSAIASMGQLHHSSTPSCVCNSPSDGNQVITGAYDGIVRLWDLRSPSSAAATFGVNPPGSVKKILSVDWWNSLVGVGSEGGLDIWHIMNNN
jgi:ribosome biogenesis protein